MPPRVTVTGCGRWHCHKENHLGAQIINVTIRLSCLLKKSQCRPEKTRKARNEGGGLAFRGCGEVY